MDESDCYYDDILDGLSEGGSSQSSDDADDDCRRLFNYGKHLSREDKEIILGTRTLNEAANGDDGSNLSFEQEMENEAKNHVNGVHISVSAALTEPTHGVEIISVPSTSKTKEQRNDELLYDPDEDDSNQKWIDSRWPGSDSTTVCPIPNQDERRRKLEQTNRLKKPNSDASLSCPCCLSLLCTDCQQHNFYKTQYRAMFVLNCRIDYTNKLIYKNKEELRKQFKRGKKFTNKSLESKGANCSETGEVEDNEVYYAVHCTTCNTQVAVYDIDQVYHFFSVLAGH